MQVGRLNGSTKGISAGYTHYVVFNLALNWAGLTSTYLMKVTFDGPSGGATASDLRTHRSSLVICTTGLLWIHFT